MGRSLELVVRDTGADPERAVAAVDELAQFGVVALAGEFHSVVARAVAGRAEALALPYLCSSAVLDQLTDQPAEWVARLAPEQSRGWHIYADFLLNAGHRHVAVVAESSPYWSAGLGILRDGLAALGGNVVELDATDSAGTTFCDELVASQATALLVLTGYPQPAVSLVRSVRRDQRLETILIGAPAGQPELTEWLSVLGVDGAGISFLRYLPEQLSPVGRRIDSALRDRLSVAPSFVAFEGYDAIVVLAQALRSHGGHRVPAGEFWRRVAVHGSRGQIRFARTSASSVWQWTSAPVQVADRDPVSPDRLRTLHVSASPGERE